MLFRQPSLKPWVPPASERSTLYGFDQRFCSGGELVFFALQMVGGIIEATNLREDLGGVNTTRGSGWR